MKQDKLKEKIFQELQETDNRCRNWTYREHNYYCFRTHSAYRLTYHGLQLLKKLYDHYSFEIEADISSRDLILLSRHMKYPYYISAHNMTLFGSEDAFLFKLYQTDLRSWLRSYE